MLKQQRLHQARSIICLAITSTHSEISQALSYQAESLTCCSTIFGVSSIARTSGYGRLKMSLGTQSSLVSPSTLELLRTCFNIFLISCFNSSANDLDACIAGTLMRRTHTAARLNRSVNSAKRTLICRAVLVVVGSMETTASQLHKKFYCWHI